MVQPLSNLIATDQAHTGDLLQVHYNPAAREFTFFKEAEGMPLQTMAQMAGVSLTLPFAAATGVAAEPGRTNSARSSRRG